MNGRESRIYHKETMKKQVVSALLAAAVVSTAANAVTIEKQFTVKSLRAIAEDVSVVELPAKAAEIVASADEDVRERVAIRTVRVFLQNHHSLAPSLVAAISAGSPEVAAAVAAEAVKLFPESAYSITKAAATAAPEQAVQIALRAAKADKGRVGPIAAGVRRAIPDQADQFNGVLAALVSGDRVESVDLAIITVQIRIGTSRNNTPADIRNLLLNNPAGQQQQSFKGITVTTKPVFDENGNPAFDEFGNRQIDITVEVDTDVAPEIPENLSGAEEDNFDQVIRDLLATDDNSFTREVIKAEYTL